MSKSKRENYKDERPYKHVQLKPLLNLLRTNIGCEPEIALRILEEIELRLD